VKENVSGEQIVRFAGSCHGIDSTIDIFIFDKIMLFFD
jgi:hypothetical protein